MEQIIIANDSSRTFADFVSALSIYGDRIAYRYLENGNVIDLSFSEVVKRSKAIASYLVRLRAGNPEPEHIAIIGSTSSDWVCTFFGIALSGNISLPLDCKLSADSICSLLRAGKVSIVFMSGDLKFNAEELKLQAPGVEEIIRFDSDMFKEIRESSLTSLPENHEEDLASIIFTSGTTGDSKGVMLTHRNMVSNVIGNMTFEIFKNVSVALSAIPIHHTFELVVNNMAMLYQGKTICINDKVENLIDNMRRFKPETMLIVPLLANKMYSRIIEKVNSSPSGKFWFDAAVKICNNLEHIGIDVRRKVFAPVLDALGGELKVLVVGGAALREDVREGLEQVGIEVYPGYGLTENSPVVSSCSKKKGMRSGSVGQLFPETEARIVDGEIWIKGPSVMKGYFENEKATNEVLVDGWLRTGDLGHFDEDGFLYITGRKKNVIILENGDNVYPEEIEDEICHNITVQDAMVYERNGVICAQVLPAPGTSKDAVLKGIRHLNETLPAFKRITDVTIREKEFPKTTTMKIKRSAVLAELDEVRSHREFKAPTTLLEKRICAAFGSVLAVGEISVDDNFFELGGDSLKVLELSSALGIQSQAIYDNPTVSGLAVYMKSSEEVEDPRAIGINEIITNSAPARCGGPQTILLTGATGYLGSHILARLMKEKVRVITLVRSASRLEAKLRYYFPKEYRSFNFETVKGDISENRLGLSDEDYSMLCDCVDSVVHVAASVRHVGFYKDAERVNVIGTDNVIEFCKASNAVLHHTSTASVSGAGTVGQVKDDAVFSENVLDIGQQYEQNVYIHSKYKAEERVLLARENGLNSNIYRIGNLTWRSSDGKFQENAKENGFVMRSRAFRKMGVFCSELDEYPNDFTAVDKCADAYVRLLMTGEMNHIYHLVNPRTLRTRDLLRHGKKMLKEQFLGELKKHMPDPDVAVLSFYTSMVLSSHYVPLQTDYTVDKLKELGFKWPRINYNYLRHFPK